MPPSPPLLFNEPHLLFCTSVLVYSRHCTTTFTSNSSHFLNFFNSYHCFFFSNVCRTISNCVTSDMQFGFFCSLNSYFYLGWQFGASVRGFWNLLVELSFFFQRAERVCLPCIQLIHTFGQCFNYAVNVRCVSPSPIFVRTEMCDIFSDSYWTIWKSPCKRCVTYKNALLHTTPRGAHGYWCP